MKPTLPHNLPSWIALLAVFMLALSACSPAVPTTADLNDNLVATIVQQTLAAQQANQTAPATEIGSPSATPPAPLVETQPAATATEPATPEPTATAQASPTPQPTATETPKPTSTPVDSDPRQILGGPSFTDPMDDDTYWPTDEDKFTSVDFDGGRMDYTAISDTDGWRLLSWPAIRDFYVEIRGAFEDCSDTDHYGLIVRVPEKKTADRGYLFGISCDGRFSFNEWDGTVEPNGSWTSHIFWKESSAIEAGSGESNRVGLMAVGNRLTLFVNGVKVGEILDSTFEEGSIGIYVGSDATDQLTARIDELSLWDLSE